MCGIIGFVGGGDVLERLTSALERLEYRGYDSAGVAYFAHGKLHCVKSSGRLPLLCAKLENVRREEISCGIGHTRWATHGAVNDINAHPLGNGRVYGVHNGMIENVTELDELLISRGYVLESQTDTERALLLFDLLHREGKDHVDAMLEGARRIRGSFAVGVLFADSPDTIYAQRRDSPLLICRSDEGYYISSDISAPSSDATEYTVLEDGELAVVKCDSVTFYTSDGEKIEKSFIPTEREELELSLGDFPHHMLREIYDEPRALSRALEGRIVGGLPSLDGEIPDPILEKCSYIHIVACGTAYHAGLYGAGVIERLARVRVNVEIASEFRSKEPIFSENDIVIAISQSGETADTLAAMRSAKSRGVFVLALVNVTPSTISREADAMIRMRAGAELSVASTKAYTVQCALLYLFALRLSLVKGKMSRLRAATLCDTLQNLPRVLERQLETSEHCRAVAEKYACAPSVFFIGRGHDSSLALEAALKMKEITYKHSEACAAGELKHGTISLIESGTPVLAFVTDMVTADKSAGNIAELAARGADVILISPPAYREHIDCAEHIPLDEAAGELSVLCAALVAQLIAYYSALHLGRDVDRPRNLAKSVTVE